MVKAMYSGVAGLKAHQSKMDVIGNNIANVNTWGYKAMDTSFKESIYQTMTGGSGGSTADGGMGGTNPSMVGYGAMVSTISSNFTTGTQVPTGQPLDMFIDGTGFFAVGPMYGEGESTSPSNLNLSRVGDFRVINNYLVDGNGRYIYGFSMEKGGKPYVPEALKERTVQENQPIPAKGIPKNIPERTINGVTTSVTYAANVPNDGKMSITTTTKQGASPATWFGKDHGIKPPTTPEDLQTLVTALNIKGADNDGVTTRYALSTDKDMKDVTITRTGGLGSGGTAILGVFAPTGTPPTTQDWKDAVDAANAGGGGITYKYEDTTPPQIVATEVKLSRGNANIANDPPGVPQAVPGSSNADIDAAIGRENVKPSVDGVTIRYAWNAEHTQVIQTKDAKVEGEIIPLPTAEIIENEDGSTTTISYEDNKKNDGTATKIILTVTPVDENVERKGPPFDDGRMTFDPKTGTYKMATGVDTLKPLKLPTTCIYYDDFGVAHEEKDIQLGSFHIEKDGKIYGTSAATNRTYLLGAVSLVSVSNPSGMQKSDGPYYSPSGSSGTPKVNEAGGAVGSLAAEFLESANVDIATEFSTMITTQRGFQANSKIITVSDEMLQELVNMKR